MAVFTLSSIFKVNCMFQFILPLLSREIYRDRSKEAGSLPLRLYIMNKSNQHIIGKREKEMNLDNANYWKSDHGAETRQYNYLDFYRRSCIEEQRLAKPLNKNSVLCLVLGELVTEQLHRSNLSKRKAKFNQAT